MSQCSVIYNIEDHSRNHVAIVLIDKDSILIIRRIVIILPIAASENRQLT
jgi:hypothetical protein